MSETVLEQRNLSSGEGALMSPGKRPAQGIWSKESNRASCSVHLMLILLAMSCTVLSLLLCRAAPGSLGQFVTQMVCSSQLQSCPGSPVNPTGVFGSLPQEQTGTNGDLPRGMEASPYCRQICVFSKSFVGPESPKIPNWTPNICSFWCG